MYVCVFVRVFKLSILYVCEHLCPNLSLAVHVCVRVTTTAGEERQTIYFWIGRHATNHERGTAALLATEMYNTRFRGRSVCTAV